MTKNWNGNIKNLDAFLEDVSEIRKGGQYHHPYQTVPKFGILKFSMPKLSTGIVW